MMETGTCPKCGAKNDPRTRYCCHCGSYIAPKKSLRRLVKSLNPISLAGAVMRPVNIAPLTTKDLLDHGYAAENGAAPVYPLKDHSWFCPDCGEHNAPFQTVCKGCGRFN